MDLKIVNEVIQFMKIILHYFCNTKIYIEFSIKIVFLELPVRKKINSIKELI